MNHNILPCLKPEPIGALIVILAIGVTHCFFSDGVGRSGCLATIMSVIERVKIEQTVDVFKTIKLIRAKRPGAVNTLVSYLEITRDTRTMFIRE